MKPQILLATVAAVLAALSPGYGQSEAWVARFHELGNSATGDSITYESASAIAVDADGNVYVTGWSIYLTRPYESATKWVTIKYGKSGDQQWAAYYYDTRWPSMNNSLTVNAEPSAIAVDGGGNVYVTGAAPSADNANLDFATIKYDHAGNQLWVATYAGPGNGYDRARKIAIDAFGAVTIAGSSAGSGTGLDLAVVQYDASGNERWVARYDGFSHHDDKIADLKVGPNGEIYIAGSTDSSGRDMDFVTIKYDHDGSMMWTSLYNGAANDRDEPAAMAVDGSGNVYVTGGITTAQKSSYYNDSTGQWIETITGASHDGGTVKYDPDGHRLWVRTFRLSADIAGASEAYAIALDNAGRISVLGGQGASAYGIVQYDLDGNQLQVMQPANFSGSLYMLAVDHNGNIVTAGQGRGGGTGGASSGQYSTLMFGADGTELWDARYDNPTTRDATGSLTDYEYPAALAVDAGGNVYVTGSSFLVGTGADIATVKYEAPPLASRLVTPTRAALLAICFADGLNGWAAGAGGVILRTSDGGNSWQQQPTPVSTRLLSSISFIDASTGFAVGKKGTILRTVDGGTTWTLSRNGQVDWTKADLLHVRAVDAGHAVVTGKRGIVLTTSDGGATWLVTTQRPVKSMKDVIFSDLRHGWAVGSRGAILRTADGGASWQSLKLGKKNFTSAALNRVAFTDSLVGWTAGASELLSTTDGGESWTKYSSRSKRSFINLHVDSRQTGTAIATGGALAFLQPGGPINTLAAITSENLNDLCFVNASTAFGAGQSGSIVRFSVGAPTIAGRLPSLDFPSGQFPTAATLYQNYPNPFNPTTTLAFELVTDALVSVKVYNVLGQEVATLADREEFLQGTSELEFDASSLPSGLYYARMTGEEVEGGRILFNETKKMVLLR